MSRASISTGSISFDSKPDRSESRPSGSQSEACHFVILSDFSGRSHRGMDDHTTIADRKVIEIDRDNFDEVFTAMQVVYQSPIDDSLIKFDELDEMHPDVLYENLDVFNKFRSLKKRLKSSSTFNDAAQEIMQWSQESATDKSSATEASDQADAANVSSGNLLEDILSGTDVSQNQSGGFNLNALVKDIVAPYVEPKPDPQQKELLNSVDRACSHLMRQLMHAPQFQSMESAWTALYWLVKRTESDAKLKLFIVDVSSAELALDAESAETYSATQIHKLLVDKRSAAGSVPFSAIVFDEICGKDLSDIQTLSKLAQTAQSIDALVLSGATEQLAGCESLGAQPELDDWSYELPSEISEAWQNLRSSQQAGSVISVAPRFLTRMPYGKKSSPTEQFQFEELPAKDRHGYYLWGNGAWLIASLMTQAFAQNGQIDHLVTSEIERLPLHVFDDDGESVVTPCAEILMLDSVAGKLREQGLTIARSVLNKDSVLIPEICTLAD